MTIYFRRLILENGSAFISHERIDDCNRSNVLDISIELEAYSEVNAVDPFEKYINIWLKKIIASFIEKKIFKVSVNRLKTMYILVLDFLYSWNKFTKCLCYIDFIANFVRE